MTTDRHTTIVDVDNTKAIAQWGKLEKVIDVSGGAAQRLAAGMRLADDAGAAVSATVHKITTEQAKLNELAKDSVAATKQAAEARRVEAGIIEHEAVLLRSMGAAQSDIIVLQQRALGLRAASASMLGDEASALAYTREAEIKAIQHWQSEERQSIELVKREGVEREQAWRAAEDNARRTTEQLKKAHAEADETSQAMNGMGAGGGGGGLLGFASKLGNVAAGLQAVISGLREAASIVDGMAEESYAIQGTARNLQLDLSAARAAAGGLVSDYELAISANKAYAMGVATTGDEFGRIVGMVGQQATKLGKDQTQLISDYVEAVGKQETEVFDNLGMTLRLTDAYGIYAESIGVASNELTKSQKADAFKVAAMIELEEATGSVTIEVEGNVRAWKELKVEYDNVQKSLFGFNDIQGRVNEALRELDDEQIDRLRFAEMADDNSSVGKEALAMLEKWDISLVELRGAADTMGMSYQDMLKNAVKAHARLAEEAERNRIEEEKLAEVRDLTSQADDLDHMIALLDIEGLKEKEKIQYQIDSLEVRREAAIIQAELTKSTADEAAILAIERKIELLEASKTAKKKGGGGKKTDANEQLDRETAAALRLLDARAQLYESGVEIERDLDVRAAKRQWLIELQREELDVRERAAGLRVVKGAAEQDKLEAEQLEILTERRTLDFEAVALGRAELERASDESLAARDREIDLLQALGVETGLLEAQRRSAHLSHLREYGEEQEILDAQVESKIALAQAEQDAEITKRTQALDEFDREAELSAARGILIQDEADLRAELQIAVALAEGDEDAARQIRHEREVARIKGRFDVQRRVTDASNKLLTAGSSLFSAVADATIKDEAKRERAVLRARGVEAVARGALETVEAVASFARYDFVGGALHVAGAATAFATGIPMIAGRVPGQGGGAGTGGGGGGSSGPYQTQVSDSPSSSNRDRPSTPASAEELAKLRGGLADKSTGGANSGGTVYNIDNRGSTNVANDTGQLFSDLDRKQKKAYG